MSLFYCSACGGLRDSDEGCEEAPASKYQLICAECVDEAEDEREAAAELRADR